MDHDAKSRNAQQLVVDVFTKTPEAALNTNTGVAEISDGLACTFTQDGHVALIDMAESVGGSDTGPSPGFYGRAAIAGCLAVGIKMTAQRAGIKFSSVRVGIEQNWDNRGVFAMPGAPSGPLATRLSVQIVSDEPLEAVQALVEGALAHDPWVLSFRDAQRLSVDVFASPEN